MPSDACQHNSGRGAAIYLNRRGAATRVRSWTPLEGPFHGFLITHNDAISVADYDTLGEGGMVWAMEHPTDGVVEADQLDHARVLEIAGPYLGEMAGAYSDWTPLEDRGGLFAEETDDSCPWQFGNFRVA